MPVRVGFAYSVVVNAKGDRPYCEIATKDFCGLCWGGEERSRQARLRVVEGPNVSRNEKEMKEEIKENIEKPKVISWVRPVFTGFNDLIDGYPYELDKGVEEEKEKEEKEEDGYDFIYSE